MLSGARFQRLEPFLRRRVLLLSADGQIAELQAPSAIGRLFRRPLVLISRALCHHEPYAPPHRLGPRARASAALLAVEVNPPFERSGSVVAATPTGFSLWSWNAELVDRLMGDRVGRYGADFLPETLFHDHRDGARLVDIDGGVEAQAWDADHLRASLFMARSFSASDWNRFSQSAGVNVDGHGVPRTEDRSFDLARRPSLVEAQSEWRWTARAAGALSLVFLAASVWQIGETLRLRSGLALENSKIARLDEARLGTGNEALTQRQLAMLRTARARLERPDPLTILAEAKRLADAEGLELTSFTIDTSRLRVGVNSSDADALQAFALALEQSALMANVSPQTDNRSGATFFFADASGRTSN